MPMLHQAGYPTPFDAVNALMARLHADVRTVLGSRLVGIYLHGSVAAGDFDPQRSDIDFVVVTADQLPPDLLAPLERLHSRIANSDLTWASHYEGSYLPQRALRRYDPDDVLHPAVRVDGSFGLDRHGSDWVIQRHLLREHGIVIAGPPPHTLIDPVSPSELQWAAHRALQEWWAPQLSDPSRLRSSEYQAYAVLTMCRALTTIETGTVATKPQAARWAQEKYGEQWSNLIAEATAWRHGVAMDRLQDGLAFVRFALERAQVAHKKSTSDIRNNHFA